MKPARLYRKTQVVPCPRCYAPLDQNGYCWSKGCMIVFLGGERRG